MSVPGICRQSFAAFFALGVAAALLGCNSGAYRDVYQQKMAGEIRILEDQLYEADYHNRVLSDELERCRVKAEAVSAADIKQSTEPPKSKADLRIPSPIRDDDTDQDEDAGGDDQDDTETGGIDMEQGFDDSDLELPPVETGEPVDPDALRDPGVDELSPPGLPEPPGKEDLEVPPIETGEILPPPADGGVEELRPGQIEIPDSVSSTSRTPDTLKIHTGLSSGITGDQPNNEMTVVIHVVDRQGRTVNLADFEIAAKLSLVVLDPARDASEARIGRWDFDEQEITELIKSEPISGLHVPIKWHGDRPTGQEIVVHARLRAEEDEMRCERRMAVVKKKTIAEWTPRGDDDIRR